MNAIGTGLKDAYLITNQKFEDERGFFIESFNLKEFRKIVGYDVDFVQDNHSRSICGVLRGLHYQIEHPQGKLVRCVSGAVYDVIVDLRKTSPTFGQWYGIKLDSDDLQLWVPPGFAHGFYVTSNIAEVTYKVTDYYYPEYSKSLIWNDPELNIYWGNIENLIISEKDLNGDSFLYCKKFDYDL